MRIVDEGWGQCEQFFPVRWTQHKKKNPSAAEQSDSEIFIIFVIFVA